MDSIKLWWSETRGHLGEHWTGHVGPALTAFGIPFVAYTIHSAVSPRYRSAV